MKANKPLLIVLSCTRNYGWVTRAFLEYNACWADYIIIVDQMSTDGTREMCAEYGSKVIIVDDPDLSYKESTRAKMAFDKGREIAGDMDHIFFALDIDEVMPANWMATTDGKKILTSKPGDEFSLHWANLLADNKTYQPDAVTDPWTIQYKIFHDCPTKEFNESSLQMHAPLLPYMNWDTPPYEIKDFPLLHFGQYHTKWNIEKKCYYSLLDIHQNRSSSIVKILRMYTNFSKKETSTMALPVLSEWFDAECDLYSLIDLDTSPIFIQYMRELIEQDGIRKFAILDIWTPERCQLLNVPPQNQWYNNICRAYVRKTQKYKQLFIIKIIDEIITYLWRYICNPNSLTQQKASR